MSQDNRKLVEAIVKNYYGMMETLRAMKKEPKTTLKEYLEGIMLSEPDVYNADDLRYGLRLGARFESEQKG